MKINSYMIHDSLFMIYYSLLFIEDIDIEYIVILISLSYFVGAYRIRPRYKCFPFVGAYAIRPYGFIIYFIISNINCHLFAVTR